MASNLFDVLRYDTPGAAGARLNKLLLSATN